MNNTPLKKCEKCNKEIENISTYMQARIITPTDSSVDLVTELYYCLKCAASGLGKRFLTSDRI